MSVEALVLDTMLAVLAAPLAGVALAHRRARAPGGSFRRLRAIVWRLGALAAAYAGGCGIADWSRPASASMPHAPAVAFVTLAAVTLTLAAVGACCGSAFSDVLDGAACALAIAVAGAAGLLMLGSIGASAPTPVIDAALLASPVFATASAANIDVLRSDLLYGLSPLARVRFDYPPWQTSVMAHVAVAGALFAATAFNLVRRGRVLPAERISI